jgi:hypothetical protein
MPGDARGQVPAGELRAHRRPQLAVPAALDRSDHRDLPRALDVLECERIDVDVGVDGDAYLDLALDVDVAPGEVVA